MQVRKISLDSAKAAASVLGRRILDSVTPSGGRKEVLVWGVPRGGVPVALLLEAMYPGRISAIDSPIAANIAVDDIYDTGKTACAVLRDTGLHTYPLYVRAMDVMPEVRGFGTALLDRTFLEFPWEITLNPADSATGAMDCVTRMLQAIGEDPKREGLLETPARVVKSWSELFGGYKQSPADFMKTFEDGAENYDGMIVIDNIPVRSFCLIGSTFVETPRGRVPIQDMKHGDWIYTVEPNTMELKLTRCHRPRITQRNAKLVRVMTDNDTVICTPDHKFLLTDGSWVEAKNLTNGMRLCSLYKGTMKSGTKGKVAYYPTLVASRYTRHDVGLTITGPKSDGHIAEHRFIAAVMNEPLANVRIAVAHHEDEQVWNNVPENIRLLSIGDHNRAHRRTQKLANSAIRKAAAATASGREDVRNKRAASVKAHWDNMSEQERLTRTEAIGTGIKLRRNHIVLGVEAMDRTEDVWCMTVPGTHTFFANGIAVHNCEHHMLPFVGVAHVGYIPSKKIPGLSKIPKVVDMFARRLQVQERLTVQIADTLMTALEPLGVAVVVRAAHSCMECRGIKVQGCSTETRIMRGAFFDCPATRAEFLSRLPVVQ